jgi:hypothetical protein
VCGELGHGTYICTCDAIGFEAGFGDDLIRGFSAEGK